MQATLQPPALLDPPAPRGIAARLRHPATTLLAMILLCVGLTLLAAALTSPWKLDLPLDNDTARYYDTQHFEVHGPRDVFAALADPFFRPHDGRVIEAPAGKPVFVSLLRLWGMVVRTLFGHDAWLTRASYYHFELITYGLLGFTVCLLGRRLGSPYLGMLAATITLANPWALVQLVYRNYTCLGVALLLAACLLMLRRTTWATLLAGVVAWMAFLTDNAVLVYAGVLGIVVVALHARAGWRHAVLHGALYAAGMMLPYVLLSLVGAIRYRGYDWPLAVTIDYFTFFARSNHFATRPPPEARPNVPKYPAIALLFIYHNSRVICGLIVAAVIVTFWKVARVGPRAAATDRAIAPLVGLFLPVLVCWTLIDLKPGAQLAHTYFVGYPLVALGLAIFWWRLANRTLLLRCAWGLLAAAYVMEIVAGLRQYRTVFFSLQNTIASTLPSDPHQKIAILYNDPHAKIMQHLLSPEYADRVVILLSLDQVAQVQAGKGPQLVAFKLSGPGLLAYDPTRLSADDRIACVLFGPVGETMTYCPPVPVWDHDPAHGRRAIPTAGGLLYDGAGPPVAAYSDPNTIPFYGLYPLLIFDDEWPTWKYITGEIDDAACTTGRGAIRMLRITPPERR